MASIVDSFNDALNEDKSYLKICLFAIPVYFIVKLFLVGKMALFTFYGSIVGLLFLGLLSQGIHNVRLNKKVILSLNPIELGISIVKSLIVIVPYAVVLGFLGKLLTAIHIPVELPHVQQIYSIIVWSLLFSILLTAYLSFAKYLKVMQGFNLKVVFESCVDVLVSFLFFIPQLLFVNVVLVGPVAYLYFVFHLPFNHWGFIACCSAMFVVNLSIMANYLAQSAYEHIKGNNEDYEDNVQINIITDVPEKFN